MRDKFWKDFFDLQYELYRISCQLEQFINKLFNFGMRAMGFKPKKIRGDNIESR